ncbi:hypothetical protein FisN_16Hh241 [Fistulifera solaris]|uniref:YCII-related domain-containing protein n=1 Tax=Fistulifera solaris TaxID=1519565 RepID=A0A1Z5KTB4_FISSO|nr:hypothetical protein FisN_16Hh241 [Fistulifera solaris]|eukprot:GAX29325.1 hypothetical protein FisN_16Hh241 [Fistulifera solaris]
MFNLVKSLTTAAFVTLSSHPFGSYYSTSRLFRTTTIMSALPDKITVLEYAYVPDVLEKRGPYRAEHLELAQSLIAQDRCLAGGPFTDGGSPLGAYFWFTSDEAAREFVAKDPYVANGIVTGHKIYEWSVVVQK